MTQVLVLVWRESLEAVLIVGILYGWLKRSAEGRGIPALWTGVGLGLGVSLLLGLGSMGLVDHLSGDALEIFQTVALFVGASLLTHMVLWMQQHGRHMKGSLEENLNRASGALGSMGIALIATLAVGREGAETVVFLLSASMESGVGGWQGLVLGSLAGISLALITAWFIGRGLRWLNYRTFFRVSGIAFLLLATSLLVAGLGRLIQDGMISPIIEPVWDTSWLLDERSTLGGLLASFTGYRSRPALTIVLAVAVYWTILIGWNVWIGRRATARRVNPVQTPSESTAQ